MQPLCLAGFSVTVALTAFVLSGTAAADGNSAALAAAVAYAKAATAGQPGRISVTGNPLAPETRLPDCQQLEAFLPPETRLRGKIRVGVKCSAPVQWSAYIPITIAIHGRYLVSARKLNRGQVLTAGDIAVREGNLAELPESALTDPAGAIGLRTRSSIAAQLPLLREHLMQKTIIRQGNRVRITARGDGFKAASEGIALNHAGLGEAVRVRTASGKTLYGKALSSDEVALDH